MKRTVVLAVLAAFSTSTAFALNPQPLPPKSKHMLIIRKGGEASLNPQPLPPKERYIGIFEKSGESSLNPQPLPPRLFIQR